MADTTQEVTIVMAATMMAKMRVVATIVNIMTVTMLEAATIQLT